jgi:RHS repeat-associated protein
MEPTPTISALRQAQGKPVGDYCFTGEMQAGGLVHFRARDYDPEIGQFLIRDSWEGDANLPVSYNKWAYANGNPVRYVDPSGMISEGEEDEEANKLVERLKTTYNVEVIRNWGIVLSTSQN